MPQLIPHDWPPQLVWLAITFGILYLLMSRIALPRIGSVIENRRAKIAGDLGSADALRRETEEAIAAYEQALAEARQKAQGIAQDAREKLKAEVAAERAGLEAELHGKTTEAEQRISAITQSALAEVDAVASDVATAIVQQLIGIAPAKAEADQAVAQGRKE